jgi:lipopolysaccharide export system permease protein
MGVLDRYVGRQFAINVLALLALLMGFVVLVDVSLKADEYLRVGAQAAAAGNEAVKVDGFRRVLVAFLSVIEIWGPKLLQLYNFIIGMVLIGAMGFTFAQLVRHRELVAMMAGGIPLWRVARPVMVVTAMALVLQIANQELVIPRLAPLLVRDVGDVGKREFDRFAVRLLPDGQGRVLMARSFDPGTQTLEDVYVLERDAAGRAIGRITATSATWTGQAWKLDGGVRRSLLLREQPLTPQGQTPLARQVSTLTTSIDPSAVLASHYRTYGQTLSWRQIATALALPSLPDQTRIELVRTAWARGATIVGTLLSMLIAMPFFLTREPRNMVLQSLKAAPVAIGCVVAGVLGAAAPVPTELLPPGLAAVLPVLAMLPVAIVQITSIRS